MRLFEGRTENNNYFSELVKIEDFTTIEDCLDIINRHFLEDDDDCLYETDDVNGRDYEYCYLAQDGQVYFVERLDEFSESRDTEEKWDVDSWLQIN